jgi:hypothetical protein
MLLLLHCDTYVSESDEAFINSIIDIKHKYICECWIRFSTSKFLFCILYIYIYDFIYIKFQEKIVLKCNCVFSWGNSLKTPNLFLHK